MWVIGGGMWGRGSGCVAVTVEPGVVIVGIVARPTEYLVIAGIAPELSVMARPSREEIVTVTTCESMVLGNGAGKGRDRV